MGPQFADLDGDGTIDFVTATYDGSPHVARGIEGGFGEPVHVLDADGARVGLEMMWDKEARRWQNVFAPQCTSVAPFDWDGDGDLDLLLGDYNHGNLYLRRNGGEAGAAAFAKENEPVLAGGEPFALPGGLTVPRIVDWDGDGLADLVCGSFGDKSGSPRGGVHLFRNVGKPGAPEFAAAEALIAPSQGMAASQVRPDIALYADPVDVDGDGDLDLVVGGFSLWQASEDAGEQKRPGVWVYLAEGQR